MALPQGVNFRGSAAYVTDGANDHAITAASHAYPITSAQGNSIGWEADPDDFLDRDNGVDARLAGLQYRNGTVRDFRIDLPSSGSKNVRLAAGDAAGESATKVELFDTTSSLGVLATAAAGGIPAGSFRDATNTQYTAANWPGSNTASAETFSTTICRFRLGGTANFDVIAHAYIEDAAGGGGGDANRIRFPAQTSGMGVGGMLGGNRVH